MPGQFFRTKAILDTGEHVYESVGKALVLHPQQNRESVEVMHRALHSRMDYAFCPVLQEFRPRWCFPKGHHLKNVVEYIFEDADEPLEAEALLTSGVRVIEIEEILGQPNR
jgi:hypothetical protein